MIYVLTQPTTILQRLNFYIRGIAPSIACDKVRFGPGIVECIWPTTNSCHAIAWKYVMRIIWEGGYSQDVQSAKAEFMEAMGAQTGMCMGGTMDLEEPLIMPADAAHVEGYW